MFGKRNRTSLPPPTFAAAMASANATTAARAASLSLSAAAASAALKALPTPVTNVATVQTARTQRRSASSSSAHSLGRRGSLVDRSLRSPSPSPHRLPLHIDPDIPPMPDSPTMRNPRPQSLRFSDGPTPWFTAAAVGDLTTVRIADAPTQAVHTNSPPLKSLPPPARSGSVSPSVNFSYPRSFGSPDFIAHETRHRPPASQRHQRSQQPQSTAPMQNVLVFDPNTRRLVSKPNQLAPDQPFHSSRDNSTTSDRTIRQRRPQVTHDLSQSGSHLARGTVARTKSSVESETNNPSNSHASSETNTTTPRQPAIKIQSSTSPSQLSKMAQISPERTPHSLESTLTERDAAYFQEPGFLPSPLPTPTVPNADKPVFQADREPSSTYLASDYEESPLTDSDPVKVNATSDMSPIETSTLYNPSTSPRIDAASRDPQSIGQDPVGSGTILPADRDSSPMLSDFGARDSARPNSPSESGQSTPLYEGRTDEQTFGDGSSLRSHSPVKTAHFDLDAHLPIVLHSPPIRSLSPRKSALKQFSPSRGEVGSDDSSEASREDTATILRKKAVRVSFNESHTIVGESAAQSDSDWSLPPLDTSSVDKPRWYHLSRPRRGLVQAEQDEPRAPRPALPFFSSVRQYHSGKAKSQDERPLVLPRESSRPSSLDSFPSRPLGHSSDDAIAFLLARELDTKRQAIGSVLQSEDPLPPVVTSVEGPAYVSDSSNSDEDDVGYEAENGPDDALHTSLAKDAASVPEKADLSIDKPNVSTVERAQEQPPVTSFATSSPMNHDLAKSSVPQLALSPATPKLKDERQSDDYLVLPGQFPTDEDDESLSRAVPFSGADSPPLAVFRPIPLTTRSGGDGDDGGESDSDERSSIYSDAYEDISDTDADVFSSLDAVVATPLDRGVSQALYDQAMTGPRRSSTADAHLTADGAVFGALAQETTPTLFSKPSPIVTAAIHQGQSSRHEPENDWESVKTYWRSLSVEKRRQLQQETLQEAGEDADLEVTGKADVKKPRRKKSTENRTSHSQASQLPRSQQPQHPQRNPQRVYQIAPGTSTLHRHEILPNAPTTTKAPDRQASGADRLNDFSLRRSLREDADPVAPREGPHEGPRGIQKTLRPNVSVNAIGTATSGQSRSSRQSRQTEPAARLAKTASQAVDEPSPSQVMAAALMKTSTFVGRSRRGSDSSDTSFTRLRARSPPSLSGFRRTMRASGVGPRVDAPPSPASTVVNGSNTKKHRFSLRSLSPQGRLTMRSSSAVSMDTAGGHGDGMKRTLRAQSSEASRRQARTPTLRRSQAANFKSRFADSSSDDDDGTIPAVLRPKTPRSWTSPKIKTVATTTNLPPAPPAPNPPIPNSSGRPSIPHARRNSLLSVLRRKKSDPPGTIQKINRRYGESAARLDTGLERSASELSVLRRRGSHQQQQQKQQQQKGWPLHDDDDQPPGQGQKQQEENQVERPVSRRTLSQTYSEGDVPPRPPAGRNKMMTGLRKVFGRRA